MAVVQQPVQDCGGDHRIAEHAAALRRRAVALHKHRAALVAAAHQLEEQVGSVGLERQVALLVDDQQLGLREVEELLLEPAFGVRSRQLRHQACRRHERVV